MAEEKVLTVALSKIAAELAEKHEMSKKGMGELLANFVELTVKNLKKGNKVRITGLGIFQVKKRPARLGPEGAADCLAPFGDAPRPGALAVDGIGQRPAAQRLGWGAVVFTHEA